MTVTTTKKFNWTSRESGETRTYFPGNTVEEEDAAYWAIEQGYGEERGEDTPARARFSPENKATEVRVAGQTKEGRREKRRGRQADDEQLQDEGGEA